MPSLLEDIQARRSEGQQVRMSCSEDVPLRVSWHKVSEETGKTVREIHSRRCGKVSEEKRSGGGGEMEEEEEKEKEKQWNDWNIACPYTIAICLFSFNIL